MGFSLLSVGAPYSSVGLVGDRINIPLFPFCPRLAQDEEIPLLVRNGLDVALDALSLQRAEVLDTAGPGSGGGKPVPRLAFPKRRSVCPTSPPTNIRYQNQNRRP